MPNPFDMIGKIVKYPNSSTGHVKVLAYDERGLKRGGDGKRWIYRLIEWDVENNRAVGGPECDHYCTDPEEIKL